MQTETRPFDLDLDWYQVNGLIHWYRPCIKLIRDAKLKTFLFVLKKFLCFKGDGCVGMITNGVIRPTLQWFIIRLFAI